VLPIGVVGVKPGLYRHYKGNSYRVLFVATWKGASPKENASCPVWTAPESVVNGQFVRALAPRIGLLSPNNTEGVLVAKWSGNDNEIKPDERIVIYVALYGDGRVSARTVKEFEEQVQQPDDTFMRPRFEWAGP